MGSQLLNSADAAYPAMARFYAAQWAAREAANEGYYVFGSCDVVAGTNAGTLKINAGSDIVGGIFTSVSAQDNIACCANADSSNPRWGILEIDSSGTASLNLGTAAASPVIPALTANHVPHAWIYIPANASAVDSLTAVANGNAKIMDARELKSIHFAREIGVDTTQTTLTNPTALASILASPFTNFVFAVGYAVHIEAALTYTNSQNASTIELKLLANSQTVFDYVSGSFASSASARTILIHSKFMCTGILQAKSMNEVRVSGAGTNSIADDWISIGTPGITGSGGIDLQAKLGTSSSTATFQLKYFNISWFPN